MFLITRGFGTINFIVDGFIGKSFFVSLMIGIQFSSSTCCYFSTFHYSNVVLVCECECIRVWISIQLVVDLVKK